MTFGPRLTSARRLWEPDGVALWGVCFGLGAAFVSACGRPAPSPLTLTDRFGSGRADKTDRISRGDAIAPALADLSDGAGPGVECLLPLPREPALPDLSGCFGFGFGGAGLPLDDGFGAFGFGPFAAGGADAPASMKSSAIFLLTSATRSASILSTSSNIRLFSSSFGS